MRQNLPYLRVSLLLVCHVFTLHAGVDVITLKDGSQQSGQVVDLGGNAIDLVLTGGAKKKILKRDLRAVTFDATRHRTVIHDSDAIVRRGGHLIEGKVEVFADGQKVRVILPSGGTAEFKRSDVVRIIRKGEAEEFDTRVYTAELGESLAAALEALCSPTSGEAAGKAEEFLARAGIFAIERVRAALEKAAPGSAEAIALKRIDRLHRLKETVTTEIEESDGRVYEILSRGSIGEKRDLLGFLFPRFVTESVPLAEFLAMDPDEDATIRAWSIDFLRRMQRHRELLDIYKRSSGQAQLASAIALGKNHILIGVPTLIEALEIDSPEIRRLAADALTEIAGQDFQFRFDGAPQARKDAVTKWWAWWHENEEAIVSVSKNVLHGNSVESPHRGAAVDLWKEAGAEVQAKRYDKAEALLRQAIDLDASFLQAHVALAVLLYANLGRPEEAVRLLSDLRNKQFAELRRQDRTWIFLHLGHSLRLTGAFEKALAAYEECHVLDPENLAALVGLGDVAKELATADEQSSAELRKERLERALRSYREAIEVLDKASENLVTLRAEALVSMGDLPFARREYNLSVVALRKEHRKKRLELSFEVAKILAIRGDKSDAVLALKGVLGDIELTKRLETEETLKALETDARYYVALLYEELASPILALGEYRKILHDLDPQHAGSRKGIERLRLRAREGEEKGSN